MLTLNRLELDYLISKLGGQGGSYMHPGGGLTGLDALTLRRKLEAARRGPVEPPFGCATLAGSAAGPESP
jgi:hypothetical protein